MLETTDRGRDYQERLTTFMEDFVYPAEPVYAQQMAAANSPHTQPQILEDLKAEAKSRGLWNLFHPDPQWGPGLTNLEYAPLAEITGHSIGIAPEAINCNAPDTGNMEVFTRFGTDEHKEKYLGPLLDGTIASAFAMTEPAVASSDATNVEMRMEPTDDGFVLNGRKWFASNGMHPNCRVLIVMGKTSPDAEVHRQQSMLVVPIDAPGVTVVRNLPVFGYHDREGHAEITFDNVRVPSKDILKGEGEGFAISQARLGPGRIHHCMRAIGAAERALELMVKRADERVTFGEKLSSRANIQEWIAEAQDRDRSGQAADAACGGHDGQARQQGREERDRRDQGCGSSHGAEDHRSRDPGPRRCRCHGGLPIGQHVGAHAHPAPGRRPR